MRFDLVLDFRSKYLRLLVALILMILVSASASGCQSGSQKTPDLPDGDTPNAALEDWFQIYFTKPDDPSSKSYRGGPDQMLADAIGMAHTSVDIAVQQLDLWSVRDALIKAHQKGVRIRMVTESDYIDEKEVQQIIAAGIPVIGDRRQGLMHNKFAVIDQSEVWVGSMNYTVSEGYRNNNVIMQIVSPRLAANYLSEFDEMFLEDSFGPGSNSDTPNPSVRINQTDIETCFSPDDGCTAELVEAIQTAKKEILFLAFSFTSDELADALIQSSKRGVVVQGVMEADQVFSNRGTDYSRFIDQGLDVRLDGNPDQMHHKLIIIDDKIIATGSFNFTYSAETANDENLLIFEDPAIAKLFLAEYQRILGQAVK